MSSPSTNSEAREIIDPVEAVRKHAIIPLSPIARVDATVIASFCKFHSNDLGDMWLVAALAVKAERLTRENERLRAAMEQIAKGEGPYSRDPLTHAANVIEDMMAVARAALAAALPETQHGEEPGTRSSGEQGGGDGQ